MHRAIPLADHGFFDCGTERNPVSWYVERRPDDPNPLGPYLDMDDAERAAEELNQ